MPMAAFPGAICPVCRCSVKISSCWTGIELGKVGCSKDLWLLLWLFLLSSWENDKARTKSYLVSQRHTIMQVIRNLVAMGEEKKLDVVLMLMADGFLFDFFLSKLFASSRAG